MKAFFKSLTITLTLSLFVICGVFAFFYMNEREAVLKTGGGNKTIVQREVSVPIFVYIEYEEDEEEEPTCPYTVTILLSAAGDVTLGGDNRWAGYHAFMRAFEEGGHEHFFANVAHIFYASCLAIVNLEGVLTDITEPHMDKEFVFRGPPHFAEILSAGHIDAVSLANNHTLDFFVAGLNDTRDALTEAGVQYFGNEFNRIIEVNGIYVGLFGHRIWHYSRENMNRVSASVRNLRDRGAQLIIAFHHWGVEGENFPEQYQINMGRYTIRAGADLVLGAHPHVMQGIEEYRGRFIVYSLADFCFGGNANPHDQDSFIFQQKFTFYRGELLEDNDVRVIPAFMSSVRYRNDFVPTVAEGTDAERIMGRLNYFSEGLR
ncbi:MAG: CapA family protein [Defluviitaleaceae bacterium]|nr:CapA family protein [Defluviitaleaceae bacterium]